MNKIWTIGSVLTWTQKLDAVLNGDLDEFIQALAEARRAELMQAEEHE